MTRDILSEDDKPADEDFADGSTTIPDADGTTTMVSSARVESLVPGERETVSVPAGSPTSDTVLSDSVTVVLEVGLSVAGPVT